MYSTKTAVTNNSEFNSSYMPVGINENVKLSNVEVLKSQQNRDYIKFTFTNSEGQEASFTEWKNEKNMWIKTDEDLQKRDDQQFGRILQIVNCFYDVTPEFEGSSFVEMITWVKLKLEEGVKNNSKDLRLKVIYDKNGYTTVSSYGTYVEPMSVAKEETQIKLFKRDLLERPVVADNESADPLASTSTSTPMPEFKEHGTSVDDLPF